MSNTEKMIGLLRRLKKEMNGAVSHAMSEGGMEYGLNYGVSAVTIREIAKDYGPNHDLARFLYGQDVRELKLAALYIADADVLSESELGFWSGGIINSEVAQYLAFVLVGRSEVAGVAVERWLAEESDIVRYAGLMTAARMLALGGELRADSCEGAMINILKNGNRLLWSGIAAVAARIRNESEFALLFDEISCGEGKGAEYVRGELGL